MHRAATQRRKAQRRRRRRRSQGEQFRRKILAQNPKDLEFYPRLEDIEPLRRDTFGIAIAVMNDRSGSSAIACLQALPSDMRWPLLRAARELGPLATWRARAVIALGAMLWRQSLPTRRDGYDRVVRGIGQGAWRMLLGPHPQSGEAPCRSTLVGLLDRACDALGVHRLQPCRHQWPRGEQCPKCLRSIPRRERGPATGRAYCQYWIPRARAPLGCRAAALGPRRAPPAAPDAPAALEAAEQGARPPPS